MKQLNVCLIIILALFASTSKAFQFSSLLEVQELKSTLFGSNLVETIALTFQSPTDKAASAKEVLKMLEELLAQLQTDQTSDTATFETKIAAFYAHIAKLAQEISQLTEQIEFLKNEIERLSDLISTADINIVSFKARIENLKSLVSEMEAANINDNKYYNQKIAQLQSLYNAFTTLLEKLDRLTGSVSSVNVPTHVNLTESEKRDVEWRSQNPNVTSKLDAVIVKSFLQLESETSESAMLAMQLSQQYDNFLETTLNADQGALRKLVGILSAIQEEVLGQKTAAQKHLDDINASYKEMRKEADAEIALNDAALAKQTENRAKYVTEKEQKTEEKASKEKRRELLKNEKTINEDLREKLKATYEKEKIERTAELEIVQKLVKIVENRLVNRAF
jgi:hypothetical protein